MKKFHIGMAIAFLAITWLLSGCSSGNNSLPPPVERINLNLTLCISEWGDSEVKKAALIVHDADGTVLNYKIFEQPEEGTHSVTFNEVPTNGFVTVLTNSLRHLTWPTEYDYDYTMLSTYPVSAVQDQGGQFALSPNFAHLRQPSEFRTTDLYLQGPCPDEASYLASEAFVPHGNYWYVSSNRCDSGSLDGAFWTPLQDNGKASLILWPAAETPWDYIEPLSYLALLDKEPDETSAFTLDAFRNDVQTAQVTVDGAPESARVRYHLTAMKGGVPLLGFSPSISRNSGRTASARFANVLDSIDKVFQTVEVWSSGGWTTRFRAVNANMFNSNDNWNLSDFLSLPDTEGLSLQQNPRLIVRASNFGNGNTWVAYRVRTISGGDSPKYIYWRAYTQTKSSRSNLQFTYPELPDALGAHMPDINSDYVSIVVSGADYNLLDNTFHTQGRRRGAYRRIRDNLTSSRAQTLELNKPKIRFYIHERVDWYW